MKRTWFYIPLVFITIIPGFLFADPQLPKTIKHSNSNCIVKVSGGEYPSYIVKKDGKAIYSPRSDGIGKALFSPSGEYIAFFGSEINWVDIEDQSFSIVVLKCSTGELVGFEKGYPGAETKWVDDMSLKYNDTFSGKDITVNVVPKANNSFRLTEHARRGN